MPIIRISFGLMLLALVVAAQQGAPRPDKLVATSSEIEALIAKARTEHRPDQAEFALPIVKYDAYRLLLQYRAGAIGPAAVHTKEAEVFFVMDGSATLVTGGKLVNEKRNGNGLTGTAIEGGSPRQVAKGDVIIVPENTPHWFSSVNGTIVLMAFHLPHSSTAQ